MNGVEWQRGRERCCYWEDHFRETKRKGPEVTACSVCLTTNLEHTMLGHTERKR